MVVVVGVIVVVGLVVVVVGGGGGCCCSELFGAVLPPGWPPANVVWLVPWCDPCKPSVNLTFNPEFKQAAIQ